MSQEDSRVILIPYISVLIELNYSQCIIFLSLIKDLEKQEELKMAHMHLKEHQGIVEQLRGIISEKKDEIANLQMDFENSNATLKAKVCFVFYLFE